MSLSSRRVDWKTLVETVHSLPLYPSHKAYVRDKILMQKPDVSEEDLMKMLDITRGEAMVILWELRKTGEEVFEMLSQTSLDGGAGSYQYTLAALGGTFSVIHVGHMALLYTAFTSAERVVVGISSDNFVATLGKKHPVPSYDERERNLKQFLSSHGWLERSRLVRLEDPYGPTVEDPTLEALVVSPHTAYRAAEINMKRTERNMNPLEVVICPLVVAEDGKPVSTTRIMNGEITVEGRIIRREQAPG